MTKLILISDPHVVTEGRTARGVDTATRLAQAIADINRRHTDAAGCLSLGDLADDGATASYDAFARLIDALRVPRYLAIGNHDHRASFLARFPATPSDTAGFVQQAIDLPGLRMLALDTVEEGTHAGRLCRSRLDWLDESLGEAPEAPTVVCLHHHPWRLGMAVDRVILRNADDLAAVIRRHPQVRLIVSGHVHRPASGVWAGRPFASLGATNYITEHHDAEKGETGTRLSQPVSYAVLTWSSEQMLLHHHHFAAIEATRPVV